MNQMPKMRVYKTGMATFPSELREKGFVGILELTPDACAILIEKPETKPSDIVKSLKILEAHFEHLSRLEAKNNKS